MCCTADGSFWSNKNAEQTHCTAKLMVALGECTMTLYIHCAWGGEKQIFYDLLYIRHSSGLDLKSISVVHSSAHLDLRQNSAPLLDTSLQVNETSFSQQASNETRCGEKLSGAVDQDWSSLGNAFSWIRMGVYEGDLPGDLFRPPLPGLGRRPKPRTAYPSHLLMFDRSSLGGSSVRPLWSPWRLGSSC